MSEFLSPPSIGINVFWLIVGSLFVLPVLIALVLSIRSPLIAFRLIRRNRSLGRDIYREVAQADRFMDIWMAQSPLISNPNKQYYRAYVFNGNRAAAQIAQIDAELAKLNLVRRSTTHGGFGGPGATAEAVRDKKYWLRNWMVFLLLLFLRITFFGDKVSHIASGNGLLTEKDLKRMYWETTLALSALFVLLLVLISLL